MASEYVIEAARRASLIKPEPKFTWRHILVQDEREVGRIEKVYRHRSDWNCDEIFYAWTHTDKRRRRVGADAKSLDEAMFELEACAMERAA